MMPGLCVALPFSSHLWYNDYMNNWINRLQTSFADNYSASTLKALIVLWALLVIVLALFVVDNPWILAGILAYEVLP